MRGAQAVPGPPRRQGATRYLRYQVDGLEIYVHPGLGMVGSAVRLQLGGFWKLRWLKLSGVAPIMACAF